MEMTLAEIAAFLNAECSGNPDLKITGAARIEEAGPGDISFIANKKYGKHLEQTRASALVVPQSVQDGGDKGLIRSSNPYFTFLKILERFHPPQPFIEKGIHATAVLGKNVELGKDISIGAYTVIGDNCRIGDRTVLLPGVVVGNRVKIGEDCVFHGHVSLREDVIIGDRVILHNGVVVGSDGFGFAPDAGIYHKIPQIGNVVIEDDVEIGANTTLDRATMGETRIKKGAKLDNLIQVAHNCSIGENTVIAGQTGLSGSTHIGKNVRIGGQVGFAGHMEVGDGAAIGAQSGVSKSVPGGIMVSGTPAQPHRDELRMEAAQRKIPDLIKEIKELQDRVRDLEEKLRNQ